METREIVPLQGSSSLSVSPDGHVHADANFLINQFKNWVDNTSEEEIQRTVRNVAVTAFLVSALVLLLTDN